MYSNNQEYRNIIRNYFKMNITDLENKFADLKDTDPESYDELLYDDEAMNFGLRLIFDNTKNNPMFMSLYKLAAGYFLSEDEETGLCVLLTYDYFSDFIELYEKSNPVAEDFLKLSRRLSER